MRRHQPPPRAQILWFLTEDIFQMCLSGNSDQIPVISDPFCDVFYVSILLGFLIFVVTGCWSLVMRFCFLLLVIGDDGDNFGFGNTFGF